MKELSLLKSFLVYSDQFLGLSLFFSFFFFSFSVILTAKGCTNEKDWVEMKPELNPLILEEERIKKYIPVLGILLLDNFMSVVSWWVY